MINEIVVSIICNAYNHEKYIEQTLDSFVRQKTSFKFEVLVHDDASTDGTADVIRRFWKKYPNLIKPIFQKDNQFSKGVNITWDIQLPRASGKYVAFCEGDDYWTDNNKLQLCFDFLENNKDYYGVFHATLGMNMITKETIVYGIGDVETDFTFKNAVFDICHTSSFFIRKSFFKTIFPNYFFSFKGVGDWPIRIFLSDTCKVRYYPNIMSVYRLFSNNDAWSSKNLLNDKGKLDNSKKFIKFLTKVKKEVRKENKRIVDQGIYYWCYKLYLNNHSLFEYKSFYYFIHSLKWLIFNKR